MGNSTKIEQKAIHRINDLIIAIPTAHSKLDENDKNISWDGTIDFYKNENIDNKENYDFSIPVQVKGRSKNKKKLGDKEHLDIDVSDIRNYLKKDGTLLLLVLFKKDTGEYKNYYLDLLPYNINKLLSNVGDNTKTIKLKLKVIKDSKHLEKICQNFNKNKEIQKKMDFSCSEENNLNINNVSTIKMSVWENDIKNFKPENLVGTYQYVYKYNENNIPISVDYSMIYNMSKKVGAIIQSSDKKIKYENLEFVKSVEGEYIKFGKSFVINTKEQKFNINIKGTLTERINAIKFTISLIENNYFFINDNKFKLNDLDGIKEENLNNFNELLNKYNELKSLLLKHNVKEDIDLDKWSDSDIDEFNIWMDAIENGTLLSLKSENSIIGSKKFGTLKMSIMATITEDKKFKIESIWNNNIGNKYNFMYSNGEKEYYSNNIFLNLISEVYESDDINYDEMKESIEKERLTEDTCVLINSQVLNIIDAYDKVQKEELLDYAKYLTNKLIDSQKDSDIYFINYCQILKRQNKLTEQEQEKLMDIKEKNTRIDIKLSCCLLLDSKIESRVLLSKLSDKELESYKSYPISKYLS